MVPDYSEIVNSIVSQFGADLKAIILFGSRAQREETNESDDVDLLIIADNLPAGRDQRRRLAIAMHGVGEHMWRVSPVLLTPEELEMNLDKDAPLMFGLCEGHRVLFGQVPAVNDFCSRIARDYEYQKEWRAWISRRHT
ncbi:MAG: nucleotidyltransferase domain-containing protein [Clostridia bacterium]|nr:nucleotidyltransferase domain-containing protein [Clostridia bacterium]